MINIYGFYYLLEVRLENFVKQFLP
jgi:hypothetical protein